MLDLNIKNAKILIVDDKQSNIDILNDFLEFKGYTNVRTLLDSLKAIDEINEFEPDIILLDLMMPNLNGFEVMEQIKKVMPLGKYLPILVLTADFSKDSKLKALSAGAKDFLTKPLDLIEVDLRIKNLLETKFLYKNLENQNQILDEKVKERTNELEIALNELIIAKNKVETSDKLKTVFINNISHEIRTPLNGIIGMSEILSSIDQEDEDRGSFLKDLRLSSNRLINTIQDMLEISLIVSGNKKIQYKTFYIDAQVSNLYDEYQGKFKEKGVNFVLNSSNLQNLNTTYSDIDMFYAIMRHLLNNALKFTLTGTVSVGFEYKNNSIEFHVKDTGVGIPNTSKLKILEPFMQYDGSINRSFEGNGLGLSIAKGLVELLGGKLWIESEENIGTAVYFTLPNPQLI